MRHLLRTEHSQMSYVCWYNDVTFPTSPSNYLVIVGSLAVSYSFRVIFSAASSNTQPRTRISMPGGDVFPLKGFVWHNHQGGSAKVLIFKIDLCFFRLMIKYIHSNIASGASHILSSRQASRWLRIACFSDVPSNQIDISWASTLLANIPCCKSPLVGTRVVFQVAHIQAFSNSPWQVHTHNLLSRPNTKALAKIINGRGISKLRAVVQRSVYGIVSLSVNRFTRFEYGAVNDCDGIRYRTFYRGPLSSWGLNKWSALMSWQWAMKEFLSE